MQKTAKICSKFQGLAQIFDNNFKMVNDNSNLKQSCTRGIVFLHFWQTSLQMVQGQLKSICPILVRKSVFLSVCYIFSLDTHSKTIQPI